MTDDEKTTRYDPLSGSLADATTPSRTHALTPEPRSGPRGPGLVLVLGGGPDLQAQLESCGFKLSVRPPTDGTLRELQARPVGIVVARVVGLADPILTFLPRLPVALGQLAPPVLALVDDDSVPLVEALYAAGARDVLPLPIPAAILKVKIERHARRAATEFRIAGYTVRALLGRGGMGTVYLASREGKDVALKILEMPSTGEAEALVRFHREMAALRALAGPGIPRFIEGGRAGDVFYYAMEYVPGPTLRDLTEVRPLARARLVSVVVDIADALTVLHGAGYVHRDVKPSNIIVTPSGRATLIDYGLTRLADDVGLTKSSEIVGTIIYIAPEILRGEDASPETDAFALGMTALNAALGRSPFDVTGLAAAERISKGEIPLASEMLPAPDTLTAVIDGLLDPDRRRRLGVADARRLLQGV